MEFFRQRFILIAEDNRDLAMSLSYLLKLVGFEVETVHDGRDAVAVARTRKPDILQRPSTKTAYRVSAPASVRRRKKVAQQGFPHRTAFLVVELIYLTLTTRLARLISLPAKFPCPFVGVLYGPTDFGIGIVSGVAQLIPLALDVAFYCLEVHIAIF
jgi:hypothetical protein